MTETTTSPDDTSEVSAIRDTDELDMAEVVATDETAQELKILLERVGDKISPVDKDTIVNIIDHLEHDDFNKLTTMKDTLGDLGDNLKRVSENGDLISEHEIDQIFRKLAKKIGDKLAYKERNIS